MQNVDTAYVFTMVLPYIKIGEVGCNEVRARNNLIVSAIIDALTKKSLV